VWRGVVPLPADARVDYKLVVDGDWRLDPHNPLQQWGGFGPNSELRMPAYVPSPETVRGDGVPMGTLRDPEILQSEALGYGVRYRVWTPAGYETDPASHYDHPVLLVTDGHEYADDRLGAALPVLDNLAAEGRMTNPVVVFVDPRDPVTGENRRQEQYVANPDFAAFMADELLPVIDASYRTTGVRGVLGTSLGGVCALTFAAERPGVFSRIGSMSPALWAAPDLFDALGSVSASKRFFLSAGTLYDGTQNARAMRDVLEEVAGFELTYAERSEGHSWGQWRALMAPMLEALFPPGGLVSAEDGASAEPFALTAWPNPARDRATLRLSGAVGEAVTVDAFDLLGRRVARLHDGAGARPIEVDVSVWTPGLYVLRAATPDGVVTRRLLVSR
jgi:enterochelin esterase family protein